MKRILAWVVAIVLFCPFGLPNASGDMIPSAPPIPKRPPEMQHHRAFYPTYAIAAGVVAITLTGSLVALHIIRKRNGDGPS